jgi:glycosyltransferase involved in cell wall biosynthesis
VPAFNASRTIKDCLSSLQSQSYPHWRATIVDDASSDETAVIVSQLAAFDSRIELIRNPSRRGVAFSRNLGLARATGEFATFLDADDVSLPHRLEIQLSCLVSRAELVLSTCRYIRVDSDGNPLWINGLLDRKLQISMLFRRELVLRQVGFFRDLLLGEDSEYFARVRAVFGNECEIHVPVVLYLAGFSPASLKFSDAEVEFASRNHIRHVPSQQAQQQINAAIAEIETLRKAGQSLFIPRWN